MPFLCNLCPRECSALRAGEAPGRGKGFCRMGEKPALARMALHFDEEPCISGENGSGAVFFSGCSLKCVFCQNDLISRGCFGREIGVESLRKGYFDLIEQGAHNINLVNPTHYARAIRESLQGGLPVPVVWNSGGYEKVETLKELEGMVQVYLPDLKYIDEKSGRDFSAAPNYFRYAAPALKEMLRQAGRVRLDENGMIRSGVIVRHLILPGHAEESMRILDWIRENMEGAWVSLMAQYVPFGRATSIEGLNRRLTEEEYEKVVDHMLDIGLEDGYVQELSSGDEKYIPAFDLTGVPKE
ncbi:MAG: radical SAM protein [Christensenellales bacterium]|jgi:putative pyruvate formate lyase activating enzyme